MKSRGVGIALVMSICAALWLPVFGEEPQAPEATDARVEVDPYDVTRPVGAVRTYIDACREGDYVSAAKHLNLEGIPEAERAEQGPKLARWLKIVLDRKLWIEYERLSDEAAGDLEDGLPASLEKIGSLDEDGANILMERVQAADGRQVWRFASSTVARIPSLYEEHGYGALGEMLPASFMELHFLEVRLWQWIGLLLLVLASYFLSWALVQILYLVAKPIVARTKTEMDDRILRIVASPIMLLIALAIFTAGSYLLRFSSPVYGFLGNFEKGLALVALTWLAFRFVDVLSALLGERMERDGRRTATAALPLGRRAVKVFLIALALIGVLQNLGFNVTGLIAGLGVGGLAVALAAQKSIENLFGGVTLIADQPVRVGDFCRFSDGKVGTIEEIGLRSTKVRTLDRTIVTVPNSRFSEIDLENFAVRDRIRLATTLGLRYETTPDQLRHVLVGLRKVLIAHPLVANDPARVRFSGFGASSLDVEIFAFVTTSDFNEFCAVREDIYLRFMDVVSASGTGFAFPSQTVYMGRDDGLDSEEKRKAEEEVRVWRKEGKLPFPAFSEEEIAELNGTADYPPE